MKINILWAGIVWSCGDGWKEQRKFTLKLLRQFGFGKKHTMDATLQEEADELVRDIRAETDSSGGIWEVDLNRLSACAINILWASVGGYRFDPHSSRIRRQLDLNFEMFESLGPKNLLGAIPFLKVFPVLSGFKKICDQQLTCRKFTLVRIPKLFMLVDNFYGLCIPEP